MQLINLRQPQLRMVKLLHYDAIVLFSTELICRMINVGIARLKEEVLTVFKLCIRKECVCMSILQWFS